MMDPLLKRVRPYLLGSVAAAALALGVGSPARANSVLTEDKALAPAVADADRVGSAWNDSEMQVVQTVVVSEPSEPGDWFPTLSEADLTLTPSPVRPVTFQANDAAALDAATTGDHQAVIPLPSALWTGMAGLSALATIGWRKAIARFFV